MKGLVNLFSENWLTNGYYAICRDMVNNNDSNLMELGFEEVEDDELIGRLEIRREKANNIEIYDSGFKFEDVTLFFGKDNQLVCFPTRFIDGLGFQRASYNAYQNLAKVYEAGRPVMMVKPYKMTDSEIVRYFPQYTLLA